MSAAAFPRTNRRRLLIADDSAEMREMLKQAVGTEFGDIIEAADGRELFWALLRSTFVTSGVRDDEIIVVIDVCMPLYDGLEVLDAWREFEHHVPAVVITAFPDATVQHRAERLGAVVLAKPFSPATLRQTLREVSHVQRKA